MIHWTLKNAIDRIKELPSAEGRTWYGEGVRNGK